MKDSITFDPGEDTLTEIEALLKQLVECGIWEEIVTDRLHFYRRKGVGHLWAREDELKDALEVLICP